MKKIILLIVLVIFTTAIYADKGHVEHKRLIWAENANGANTYLGETLWRFPEPVGEFTVISSGALNPDGELALPLTKDMPGNTVIVSKVDEKVESGIGQFHENIPLRMVPTYVDADFNRGELKSILDVNQDQLGQSLPNDTITIDSWGKAKGAMRVKCLRDGTATVKMRFWNLIPNALFTVWQTHGTPDGGLGATPLGGAPNVLVPDTKGKATFERTLNSCPFTTQEGTNPVLLYEIAFHSDALVYGGLPDSAKLGLEFGRQTHTILNFPIKIDGPAGL